MKKLLLIIAVLLWSSSAFAFDSTFVVVGATHPALNVTITTAATLDLATSDNCRGNIYINGDDDVIDYTLPPPTDSGQNCCFYASTFARVITVDTDGAGEEIIIQGDNSLDDGDSVDSSGVVGEFLCLVSDGTDWHSFGAYGTWSDGGP